MSDPSARRTDAASLQRTLRVGGVLLLVHAAAKLLVATLVFSPVGSALGWIGTFAFSGALVVFAVGIGRASLVARRPLGTTALLVWAAWPLVDSVFAALVPFETGNALWAAWGYIAQVLPLLAAIVAVVQIGRAGVLHGGIRWAPLWALVGAVAASLVLYAAMAAYAGGGSDILDVGIAVQSLVFIAAPATLGILALVHASRVGAGPVQVYPPA